MLLDFNQRAKKNIVVKQNLYRGLTGIWEKISLDIFNNLLEESGQFVLTYLHNVTL